MRPLTQGEMCFHADKENISRAYLNCARHLMEVPGTHTKTGVKVE